MLLLMLASPALPPMTALSSLFLSPTLTAFFFAAYPFGH